MSAFWKTTIFYFGQWNENDINRDKLELQEHKTNTEVIVVWTSSQSKHNDSTDTKPLELQLSVLEHQIIMKHDVLDIALDKPVDQGTFEIIIFANITTQWMNKNTLSNTRKQVTIMNRSRKIMHLTWISQILFIGPVLTLKWSHPTNKKHITHCQNMFRYLKH